MNSQTFNYTFNVTGNSANELATITQNVTSMNTQINNSVNVFNSLAGKFAIFNQAAQAVQGFSVALSDGIAPGADLNSSIADLSAISGEAGEGLKTIEKYAREAATTFGGSASKSVESYKLLLSQLTPELAKTPPALKAMGDNVSILSKTMGGNATAAAEVLTTAMNQYGISLADPMEASRKMAEMMNVMAAAGKEGSAELPTIKAALEQCGMAAKGAGVSFEETNAAIQVLDKAGKKGAEGGVALRNVMSILATGRFLPKDVREELAAAGIDLNLLTDKSKSLTERLNPLQDVMQDSALFTKLFGRENSNAAMALVQGISEVNRYTEAISGTNTAFEQAEIIMDSYNERKSRVQAGFEDFKISIFNITGDFGIWVETVAGSLIPLAQLVPLISGLGKAIIVVKSINFGAVIMSIARTFTVACRTIGIAIMNIPIIGWIAAAIAGLVALGIYFWNTSVKFRAVLKGLWEAFKVTFVGLWDLAKNIFSSISDLIVACFKFDGKGIKEAISKLSGGFKDYGANVGKAFNEGYNAEIAKSKAEKEGETKAESDKGVAPVIIDDGGGAITSGLSGIGGSADKADKVKNINVNIEKLIDKFEIHTTNLHEDISRVKDMVAEALVGAVNDVNYAM